MEITVKVTPKEMADFVLALQSQQNKIIKLTAGKVLSKFCDDFNLHDEEIDKLLESVVTEEMPSPKDLLTESISAALHRNRGGE